MTIKVINTSKRIKKVREKVNTRFEKLFIFNILKQDFCIKATNVIEIAEVPVILTNSKSSDLIRGVINIRGKILPVIDFTYRAGLSKSIKLEQKEIYNLIITKLENNILVAILVNDIEYRLKDGIITSNTFDAIKSKIAFSLAIIGEKEYPILDINDFIYTEDISNINKIIDSF